MPSIRGAITSLLAGLALTPSLVEAKSIYAHYMIGTIDSNTDHAKQDVLSAQAMGFDGFALNVREPTQPYAIDCINQIFAAAQGTGFKLFFSLDMNGHGDTAQFASIFSHFNDEAYLKVGDGDGRPFVSTFWGGSLGPDPWRALKEEHNLYFVPSFDDIGGYYEDAPGFFERFGDVVDGAFNWETAWPPAEDRPANVSAEADARFNDAAAAVGKDFMMAISPLQYKHCCGGHYYRIGEGNLPERITQILDLGPELIEFITWNDAGESHYVGHIWEEAFNSAPEILEYGNTSEFPHYAWGPLLTSFFQAFRDGVSAAEMKTPGDAPIGAMWYRGVLRSCSSQVPDHATAALDAVSYAFVIPASLEGATISVISNGQVLSETPAVAGLNYATIGGMQTGSQRVEISRDGSSIAVAAGIVDVQENLPNFCNFNYYVVGLE